MKFKKLLAVASTLLMGATVLAIAACGGNTPTPDPDPDPNPNPNPNPNPGPSTTTVYGLPVAEEGHYIKEADLVQDGETRYLLYTTNATAGEDDNVLAIRKATYEEGEGKGWKYGAENIVIEGDTWDEYISSGSIVKGEFSYGGDEYNWLIAYSATSRYDDKEQEIGLAVAQTPDGEWTKVGDKALIEFDATAGSVGYYAPSLVNYDKHSGIRLFYTLADPYGHFAYFVDFDASNLDEIELSGFSMCPFDGTNSSTMFPNGDFAYDAENGLFFSAFDQDPANSSTPSYAAAVVLAYIDEEELYTAAPGNGWIQPRYPWDITDTPDAKYDRLYSACIVSDAYGHVDGATEIEVVFNICDSASENSDWLFSQNLISDVTELD